MGIGWFEGECALGTRKARTGKLKIEEGFALVLLDLTLIYATDKIFNPALESTPSHTYYHEPLLVRCILSCIASSILQSQSDFQE